MRKKLYILSAILSLILGGSSAAAERDSIVIGLIDTFDPDFYLETFVPTIEHLQDTLSQYKINVVEIDHDHLAADIEKKRPNFLMASSGNFVSLIDSKGAQQIATVRRPGSVNAERAVASTLVVRSDRSELKKLSDLKGLRVSATHSSDFDGWQLALGEIASQGYNPDDFFGQKIFTNYQLPDVVTYVKVGKADVGVLGPCQYERLISTGQIQKDELRVINLKSTEGSCLRSTEMFPDVVFFSLEGTPSDAVKAITLSLLSLPPRQGVEWIPASGFLKVFDLLKSLKIGPYEHLKEQTLKGFLLSHQLEIFLAIALLFAIGVHVVRVNVLVSRRTAELKHALAQQRKIERRAQENRKKLDMLEKSRVASQMSTMFAHEVKQPITNMIYYASSLKLILKQLGVSDEKALFVIDQIASQARRTADIVEHVRGYVKRRSATEVRFNLTPVINRAIESISAEEIGSTSLTKDLIPTALVKGDPFEYELVILNLLKNALSAVKEEPDGRVEVSLKDLGNEWLFEVKDNGPSISEEKFNSLGKPTQSDKDDGLGIGLSIVVNIIESHGGHLNFSRAKPHGLIVSFIVKKDQQ